VSLFMKGQKTRTRPSPGKAGLDSPLGGTHFSAREKENSRNLGKIVHFRGSEGSKIAPTSLLNPFELF
jgi:hypothetical protein